MIVALSDAATTAPDSWTGPMEVINLSLNSYRYPIKKKMLKTTLSTIRKDKTKHPQAMVPSNNFQKWI
jgi:hypothetical protein